jgi:hypothetical protein
MTATVNSRLPIAIRVAGLILVPPTIAGLGAHFAWAFSGGERRCMESLDLSTPGLVCMPGLNLVSSLAIAALLQLIVWLPLAYFTRLHASVRKRLAICAAALALVCLAVGLGMALLHIPGYVGDNALFALLPTLGLYATLAPNWFRAA